MASSNSLAGTPTDLARCRTIWVRCSRDRYDGLKFLHQLQVSRGFFQDGRRIRGCGP